MTSKRIKFISSLINNNDKVLDIGTDHALLPIYLIKNNITSVADGSDISNIVLDNARTNVAKYNLDKQINLFCSDGVKNIDVSIYNTFIIAGMGFYTIKGILDSANLGTINKIIIQSNNNHEELRRYINKIGFKIIKDYFLEDKDKTYLIIYAVKGKQSLSDKEYVCGLYDINNIWYYKYIVNKYESMLKNIPVNDSDLINRQLDYFKEYVSMQKIEVKKNK